MVRCDNKQRQSKTNHLHFFKGKKGLYSYFYFYLFFFYPGKNTRGLIWLAWLERDTVIRTQPSSLSSQLIARQRLWNKKEDHIDVKDVPFCHLNALSSFSTWYIKCCDLPFFQSVVCWLDYIDLLMNSTRFFAKILVSYFTIGVIVVHLYRPKSNMAPSGPTEIYSLWKKRRKKENTWIVWLSEIGRSKGFTVLCLSKKVKEPDRPTTLSNRWWYIV